MLCILFYKSDSGVRRQIKCSTKLSKRKYMIISIFSYIFTETKRDNYKTQNRRQKQASGNKLTTSDRIIVISIGYVLYICFIFVIIRELCLCYRFPQPTGIRVVIDDVYAEMFYAEINSVK